MVLIQTSHRMYSVLRRSGISTLSLLKAIDRASTNWQVLPTLSSRRSVQTTSGLLQEPNKSSRALILYAFDHVNNKSKDDFLDILHTYESQEPTRRGHVDFITAAMNYMDEFGVNEDLEVYKKLLDVMPKGKFISTSPMQADFMHFPKQQQCIVDLLEKMETNGVIGDAEMEQMLLNIFGKFGIPTRKFWRMMYWMPKFRHLNPWPTPRPVPNDPMVLARLAVEKISSVDPQTVITVYETKNVEDSIDETWIISATSPDQGELLKRHKVDTAVYVEGPHTVWVAHVAVDYFVLRADVTKWEYKERDVDDVSNISIMDWTKASVVGDVRMIHEQEDATIFAVCATGTSSKDSLLSWIRCLQQTYPILEKIPVLFTLTKQIEENEKIIAGVKAIASSSPKDDDN